MNPRHMAGLAVSRKAGKFCYLGRKRMVKLGKYKVADLVKTDIHLVKTDIMEGRKERNGEYR
jgi:hypothetical protein